jgi:hypothetical protein
VEEGLIVDQGVFLSSSNSYSNQFSNSITKEHINDENNLKCSNILIEHIRDIDPQLEEETINLHQQTIPYLQERLDTCHEVVHESFDLSIIQKTNLDDHIMFESLSPKHSKSDEVREEECLENIIVNYYSSREPFHLLVSNSFYSLYPDLFLDFDVHNTLFTLSNIVPSQFDKSNIGDVTFKHNINEVGFDYLSLQSFTREKWYVTRCFYFHFSRSNWKEDSTP